MILGGKKTRKGRREEGPCPRAHGEPGASSAHIGAMCREAFCARQQAQWVLLQTLGTEPELEMDSTWGNYGATRGRLCEALLSEFEIELSAVLPACAWGCAGGYMFVHLFLY